MPSYSRSETITVCIIHILSRYINPLFQYTDWEHIDDGYLNQKMIGDVVGDFFFVCPCNYFAMQYAEHGNKVFYYYFNHVLSPLYLLVRCHLTIVPHSSGRAPTRGATGWGCCTGTRSTTCSATLSTPAGPTPTPTHTLQSNNKYFLP